jgi:hypothetical protein
VSLLLKKDSPTSVAIVDSTIKSIVPQNNMYHGITFSMPSVGRCIVIIHIYLACIKCRLLNNIQCFGVYASSTLYMIVEIRDDSVYTNPCM